MASKLIRSAATRLSFDMISLRTFSSSKLAPGVCSNNAGINNIMSKSMESIRIGKFSSNMATERVLTRQQKRSLTQTNDEVLIINTVKRGRTKKTSDSNNNQKSKQPNKKNLVENQKENLVNEEVVNVKSSESTTLPVNDETEWKSQDYLIDDEWKDLLKEEFQKEYFTQINKFLSVGYKKNIFRPPKELIFNALNSTKLDQIKVVIIGQDPYHDDDQAHGLAFSVPKGIALPPSLKNIFTELKNDLPDFERDEQLGGCLQKWTEQGVFLLNTFLTVEAHKAGSHAKIGWENFTDKIIKIVSEKNSGCVFLLWGNFAQKKESLIDESRHKIIKCAHPSPLSCKRFYGSKCFSQANAYLVSIKKTPVNWSLKE